MKKIYLIHQAEEVKDILTYLAMLNNDHETSTRMILQDENVSYEMRQKIDKVKGKNWHEKGIRAENETAINIKNLAVQCMSHYRTELTKCSAGKLEIGEQLGNFLDVIDSLDSHETTKDLRGKNAAEISQIIEEEFDSIEKAIDKRSKRLIKDVYDNQISEENSLFLPNLIQNRIEIIRAKLMNDIALINHVANNQSQNQ